MLNVYIANCVCHDYCRPPLRCVYANGLEAVAHSLGSHGVELVGKSSSGGNGGGTQNPTNGPGGQGCHHGTPVDGAAQDNSVKFTCDCDSGFKGANCMQQDSLSVGAIVGIVLAVLAAFGGGAWYYMNSKKKASMSTYGVVPGNPHRGAKD